MGSSCSTVACIKSKHMTLHCVPFHYMTLHTHLCCIEYSYLVKTHHFFLISPGVWLSSKDSSKLLCHVICVVFWLVRNHKSSKLICLGDSISLPRQFGNMILFNIYILYIHIKLYWKCHALIAALTKRVAGYLYLDLTAASKAAAIPTFHWVRSYHVC